MPFDPAPIIRTTTADGDAIRRGCELAPRQCFGGLFKVATDGVLEACAAGAWLLGTERVSVKEARAVGIYRGPEFHERFGESRIHDRVWKANDGLVEELIDGAGLLRHVNKRTREDIAAAIDRGEL